MYNFVNEIRYTSSANQMYYTYFIHICVDREALLIFRISQSTRL